MISIQGQIEPAVSLALECLSTREVDRQTTARAVRAARECLELQRPSEYCEYNPSSLVESILQTLPADSFLSESSPARNCIGDAEQIRVMVSRMLYAPILGDNASLLVTFVEVDEVPRLRVTVDGPGEVPELISFDDMLSCPSLELESIWTAATRGGRLDTTSRSIEFRFAGIRELPKIAYGSLSFPPLIREAESGLQILAAKDEGYLSSHTIEVVRKALRSVLQEMDTMPRSAEPTDIVVAISEALKSVESEANRHQLVIEKLFDGVIPPITMVRERIISYFANAVRYATDAFEPEGSMLLIVDYDKVRRVVRVEIGVSGLRRRIRRSPYLASMRRAITEIHSGTFILDESSNSSSIVAEIPDPAGLALDDQIPGWECFSEKSKQVLRLLESGALLPQREFLMSAILEEELENWLLPHLSIAPATNLAFDLLTSAKERGSSSNDQMLKALSQISRGKPKKEICHPTYAAEILWAFRIDERHRRAIGSDRLDPASLSRLTEELRVAQLNAINCLRLIAQAKVGEQRS